MIGFVFCLISVRFPRSSVFACCESVKKPLPLIVHLISRRDHIAAIDMNAFAGNVRRIT